MAVRLVGKALLLVVVASKGLVRDCVGSTGFERKCICGKGFVSDGVVSEGFVHDCVICVLAGPVGVFLVGCVVLSAILFANELILASLVEGAEVVFCLLCPCSSCCSKVCLKFVLEA